MALTLGSWLRLENGHFLPRPSSQYTNSTILLSSSLCGESQSILRSHLSEHNCYIPLIAVMLQHQKLHGFLLSGCCGNRSQRELRPVSTELTRLTFSYRTRTWALFGEDGDDWQASSVVFQTRKDNFDIDLTSPPEKYKLIKRILILSLLINYFCLVLYKVIMNSSVF